MTEPTIAELRDATEVAEIHTRALEWQLDPLAPGQAPWSHRLGIEMPDWRRYPRDDLGRERYAHDLTVARAAWLLDRYNELCARAARRERQAEAARRGLDRFAGEGGRTLDELLEPERQIRRARWEAAGR